MNFKNTNPYCLVGFILLFTSIIMNLFGDKRKIFIDFMSTLNPGQKKIYGEIIYERLSIYIKGMILGVLLGIFYLYKYPKDKFKICKFFAIVFIIKLGFYYVYPKSTMMLYHLKTQEQISAWTDIYLYMKKRWITSLIISAISYFFIAKYLF
jgi:uncharacterized membrane protein YfcA